MKEYRVFTNGVYQRVDADCFDVLWEGCLFSMLPSGLAVATFPTKNLTIDAWQGKAFGWARVYPAPPTEQHDLTSYSNSKTGDTTPVAHSELTHYIVIGSNGAAPRPHQHGSSYMAEIEARRLAKEHPGVIFTVYAATYKIEVEAQPTRETRFSALPF